MGCYGIGVTRTMAASIEQNHDENGIIWPVSIAPYQVVIIPANTKDPDIMEAAQHIYDCMEENQDETVMDDRDERAGIKFKDADLIGYPVRITVGRHYKETGCVEIRVRKTGETIDTTLEECSSLTERMLQQLAEDHQ